MTTSPYSLTAVEIREIAETHGLEHAEFVLTQAESQTDVSEARAEFDRLWNEAVVGR